MMECHQTDHQCLWMDVKFHSRIGHILPAIVYPPWNH